MAENEDNSKIEIDREIIEKLYNMVNMEMPENVSDESLMSVVMKLRKNNSSTTNNFTQNKISAEATTEEGTNNILVIDDIGVVTYQLKITLQNLGYNVKVAKDMFNGINIFLHSIFEYVIMDLFVSTEQEGYTLLNETKKIITQKNLNTKIIVITASNKAENKIKCLNGGADYFLKKDMGWQDKLIELIENDKRAMPTEM